MGEPCEEAELSTLLQLIKILHEKEKCLLTLRVVRDRAEVRTLQVSKQYLIFN
jgi:hypothetical protein